MGEEEFSVNHILNQINKKEQQKQNDTIFVNKQKLKEVKNITNNNLIKELVQKLPDQQDIEYSNTIHKKRRLSCQSNENSFSSECSDGFRTSLSGLNLSDSKQSIPESKNIPSQIFKQYLSIEDLQQMNQKQKTFSQSQTFSQLSPDLKSDFLIQSQNNQVAQNLFNNQQMQFFYQQIYQFGKPVDLQQIIRDANQQNLNSYKNRQMVGPLTKEERDKKVQNYINKKKNRDPKKIRYNTRKELADNRERVHGRFIKNQQPRYNYELFTTKQTNKIFQKEEIKTKIQENASWTGIITENLKNNSGSYSETIQIENQKNKMQHSNLQ